MAISIITGQCDSSVLDAWKFMPLVPPANLIHTERLEGFGVRDGEYCAETFCLPDHVCPADVAGAALHNDDAEGEVLLWQSPVRGQSCPAGNVCIHLTGWSLASGCCEPKAVQYNDCPCERLKILRDSKAQMLDVNTGQMLSFSGKGQSVRVAAIKCEWLDEQIREAELLCAQKQCKPKPGHLVRSLKVRTTCRR